MAKKEEEVIQDDDVDSGWNSPRCTKCKIALDYGAGHQLVDEKGVQQRYCWKDWLKYNADPKRFPGVVEAKVAEAP